MTINFGLRKCVVDIDGVPIQANGTFFISEKATNTSGGDMEVNQFHGKFDGVTTLTGTYGKILICGTGPNRWVIGSKQEVRWVAEWKRP